MRFLPFFAEGTPIRDRILAKSGPLFVRSHVLDKQALIVALNDANTRVTADLHLNLALRLTEGTHRVSGYDADVFVRKLGAEG